MATLCVKANIVEFKLLEGEKFWGGCVTDGRAMPYGNKEFKRELFGDTKGKSGAAVAYIQ